MGSDKRDAEGYSEFYRNLKEKIKKGGVSQKAVAIELGMDESWLSKILNGHRNMDVADLYRIAKILGKPVSALLPSGEIMSKENTAKEIAEQLINILPDDVQQELKKKIQNNKQGG